MAQLGITGFNRIGVRLAIRDFILTGVIPETIIGVKGITVIAFGLGSSIHNLLEILLCAIRDHFPAQKAACLAVYDGQDVDSVFLSPMNVNNSSSSAVLTCSGTGASGS